MPPLPSGQHLIDQHCYGIGLLTGATSGAPQIDPFSGVVSLVNKLRDYDVFDCLEHAIIAKKEGLADGEVSAQHIDFLAGQRRRQQCMDT